METLREKQTRFARHVPDLIEYAFKLGYLVGRCEWVRDPKTALVNAEKGIGIKCSLHCEGLAIDLALYTADGVYLTASLGYTALGTYWKSLQPDFYWGGDFRSHDYDHFSLSPDDGKTA